MRAEPPDAITAKVWQMLAVAWTSTLTREEVIEELTLSLRRDAAYLARRARSGRRTAYDEALERSMAARAFVLLEQQNERDERAGPPNFSKVAQAPSHGSQSP